MIIKLLIIASMTSALFSQSAQDFKTQQMQGFSQNKQQFSNYKQIQEKDFKIYQEEQDKVFKNYKKEIGAFWQNPKTSTKKSWVSYTEDKKTRTDVDFSKEIITVETIASSPKQAQEQLKIALAKAVTIDTKTLQETDPLEKELQKIKKPSIVVDDEVDADPILSTVIFDTKPTKENVKVYVNKNVSEDKIKAKDSSKVKNSKIYSININLPKDTMVKRSKIYYEQVKKQANIQKLPVALIFSIMHTESSFNPRARSSIPAYGLMQIVPKTAGIDSYQYLYNEKKLVTGTYLYNSTNNIKMGAAYLHILYYKYLKEIKDQDSRLYCTIAAYNTGAGNIAWAFTKTHNMKKAAPIINNKSSKEVYNKLLKDLRFNESRTYLKKVSSRMGSYYKLYGN